MKKKVLAICLAAFASTAVANAQTTLYDNGGPNGNGGYSNATESVFGARRTLLDDFTVDSQWSISDFHWQHIWNIGGGPLGSGMILEFFGDDGGTPDLNNLVATASNINYMERNLTVEEGAPQFFSRDLNESSVEFDPIKLAPGTYWWQATIVGPENNFWLTADQRGNECWVNYDDLGGLHPGSDQFGVASDLNFVITGKKIPEPASLGVLALSTIVLLRRRR